MGGQAVLQRPLELWKEERRLSFLTNSTCGSFLSNSPGGTESDMESVYTHRSSVSSIRTGRTRSRSLRLATPIYEERDERLSTLPLSDDQAELLAVDLASPTPAATMFASSTVRVWKQTPRAQWMNVFVPRYVRLQTGSHPYMEYTRQAHSAVRQRVYLTTATKLDRLPKNKLEIDFQNASSPLSSHNNEVETASYSAVMDRKLLSSRIDEEVPAPKSSSSSSSSSTNEKWVLRFETKQERDHWAKKIQDAVDLLAWINKFTLGQILTESGDSTLAECFSWLDQGMPSYVVKAMSTETKKLNANARNEIRIHHLLTNFSSHPNVLSLHDSYRQQERAYLVLEYCSGGDLFEHLHQEGALTEKSAKLLFRRIVDAIAYIHSHNVVHLDIKPENLLFKSSPQDLDSIKLADFGSAEVISDPSGQIKTTVSCTIGYAAPEVLADGDVSFAADVFSAGAVLYTMLAGFAPFQALTEEEAMEKTLSGEFSFDEQEWLYVSSQAKDLICGMLETDPRARMSMDEVLEHPWLQWGDESPLE